MKQTRLKHDNKLTKRDKLFMLAFRYPRTCPIFIKRISHISLDFALFSLGLYLCVSIWE